MHFRGLGHVRILQNVGAAYNIVISLNNSKVHLCARIATLTRLTFTFGSDRRLEASKSDTMARAFNKNPSSDTKTGVQPRPVHATSLKARGSTPVGPAAFFEINSHTKVCSDNYAARPRRPSAGGGCGLYQAMRCEGVATRTFSLTLTRLCHITWC